MNKHILRASELLEQAELQVQEEAFKSDKQRKAVFASMGMTVKKTTKPKSFKIDQSLLLKQRKKLQKYLKDNPGASTADRSLAWRYIASNGKDGEIRTKFRRGPGGVLRRNPDFGD